MEALASITTGRSWHQATPLDEQASIQFCLDMMAFFLPRSSWKTNRRAIRSLSSAFRSISGQDVAITENRPRGHEPGGSRAMTNIFYTIGHSTRTLAQFVDLLRESRVDLVLDVR